MTEKLVRRATLSDVADIVELSARVQAALTASGSLQQIGPLSLENVEASARAGHAYTLTTAEQLTGSVLVDPLPDDSPLREQWQLHALPGPLWFLHKLMLDPSAQGRGLGLDFLNGIRQLLAPSPGTIFLDCWAGNAKLRSFYLRAGFTFHGVFPFEDYEVAVFFDPPAP